MDTRGRRKTVFAGTFAIARELMSNIEPISVAEIAKGYTRAMLTTSFTLSKQSAPALISARGRGDPSPNSGEWRGVSKSEPAPRRPAGKNWSPIEPLVICNRGGRSRGPASDFLFLAKVGNGAQAGRRPVQDSFLPSAAQLPLLFFLDSLAGRARPPEAFWSLTDEDETPRTTAEAIAPDPTV
jgi:hypothetical protein